MENKEQKSSSKTQSCYVFDYATGTKSLIHYTCSVVNGETKIDVVSKTLENDVNDKKNQEQRLSHDLSDLQLSQSEHVLQQASNLINQQEKLNSVVAEEKKQLNQNIHEALEHKGGVKCNVQGDCLVFGCPHCQEPVESLKTEVACGIYRHGYHLKWISKNPPKYELLQPVPPHSSKEECDKLALNPDVTGCCKPFKVSLVGNDYYVDKCDYI